MAEFMLLMHNDAPNEKSWQAYLDTLRAKDVLRGGSAIGGGIAARKNGEVSAITQHISGYIKVEAADLDEARALLAGNPVFEAGGTVEIRALPQD
jgi:hypothetical protein